MGLALGDVRRIPHRGCTNYLVSVPGNDQPFLLQRVAQETVKFGQDSKLQGLEAQYLFELLGFSV